MGKVSPAFTKYIIHLKLEANGVVEKPDVVGAIFGQTEGLLGPDLELRELQKTGRIGRIEVDLKSENGKSFGKITIPSNLNKSETSLIAAALETIERIGPCTAKVSVESVEDIRQDKREFVVKRAQEILGTIVKTLPESKEISKEVTEAVLSREITECRGLPAGPEVESSDEIIVVEGRADVLNLMRHGINNAIAIEGTSIPKTIADLTKSKSITAFLDGDRGGELILKELQQVAKVDYVARAPPGKEVEELNNKEIYKALSDKMPLRVEEKKIEEKQPFENEKFNKFKNMLDTLIGTRGAYILDNSLNVLGKIPVKELLPSLSEVKRAYAVILDGYIDRNLVSLAREKDVEYLVGTVSKLRRKPRFLKILTPKDFLS